MVKEKDVVTVDLGENNSSSNTYLVARDLGDEALLSHPLYPGVFLLKKEADLNKAGARPKDSYERCLEFVVKYKKYLDHEDCIEIDTLCLYFVVHRVLYGKPHKERLSGLCEKIARVYCNRVLDVALRLLKDNQALLLDDSFQAKYFRSHKKFIEGRKLEEMTPRNEICLYRMAGFVLAQLEST